MIRSWISVFLLSYVTISFLFFVWLWYWTQNNPLNCIFSFSTIHTTDHPIARCFLLHWVVWDTSAHVSVALAVGASFTFPHDMYPSVPHGVKFTQAVCIHGTRRLCSPVVWSFLLRVLKDRMFWERWQNLLKKIGIILLAMACLMASHKKQWHHSGL